MAPGGARLVLALALIGAAALPLSVLAQDQPDPEATISALQTQVALLEGQEATPTPVVTAEATQDGAEPSEEVAEPGAPRTVNLEIVLDDSGSMGQLVDTGETRLEAAKRVLDEVLAAIPAEPGVNVGLRIYGHLGDNTDAGRPISCEASDLIVPVDSVDRDAIAQSVAPSCPSAGHRSPCRSSAPKRTSRTLPRTPPTRSCS